MALTPGSRLGRYVIVRQLGAGAMGEVYLAEDPRIERKLAIKTVRLDPHLDESTRNQFLLRIEREAKAAGRFVHPHVVTLFDAADQEGVFFLAFEFVDGPDLAARSRRQPPLTVKDVLRIGREAASALDAAHRVGIIHRDIKPSNLLLTSEGVLKIADFGIAALVGQGGQLTQTGSLIGTPQYLSPEQVRSEWPLDPRSDLFSLGVVLYELLAGRRPFEGSSMAGLLYSIASAEPVSLGDWRPDLPARLVAAVMRLLAKQPAERFESAAALGEELAAIERALGDASDVRIDPMQPPDEAPTLVVAATTPATTQTRVLPPTVLKMEPPPTRIEAASPPTRIESAPVHDVPPSRVIAPRRGKGLALAAVTLLLIVAGGIGVMSWRASDVSEMDALPAAASQPATHTTSASPAPERSSSQSPATHVEAVAPDIAEEPGTDARIVSGNVIFEISPSAAARDAVAMIDGLPRGPATGSTTLLNPGRHVIEIVAPGFQRERIVVESRPEVAGPTQLAVTLDGSP